MAEAADYAMPTAAEVLRVPMFRVPAIDTAVERAIRARIEEAAALGLLARAVWLEARVESMLASWGECAWTARDCLTIYYHPDGRITLS